MGKHVSNDNADTGETTTTATEMDAVPASTTAGTSPAPLRTDEAQGGIETAGGAPDTGDSDAIQAIANEMGATQATATPGGTGEPGPAAPEPANSAADVASVEADAVSDAAASDAVAGEVATGDTAPSDVTTGDAAASAVTATDEGSSDSDLADTSTGQASEPKLGAPGPTIVPDRNIVLEGPGSRRTRPSPPPRPDFSLETPAPMLKEVPFTTPMKVTRVLWLVSFALGTAAILFAGLGDGPRRTALEAVVTELATDQTTEVITALTSIVFWSSFGALLAVTVLELILVVAMFRGRGGPRWALLAVVIFLHVPVALLADAFVAVDEGGLAITILVAAQWVVAAAATTASLLPGASDWFRAKREARRQTGA